VFIVKVTLIVRTFTINRAGGAGLWLLGVFWSLLFLLIFTL
jgi:hypothetical protein